MSVRKRSVIVAGHKTSVSLEAPFWDEITAIAASREMSVSALISDIDGRRNGNLSSALRLFVLEDLRRRARELNLPESSYEPMEAVRV